MFRAFARVASDLSQPAPRRSRPDGADGGPTSSIRRCASAYSYLGVERCLRWRGGFLRVALRAAPRGSAHGAGASTRTSGAP
eukprot:1747810-Prymnesium_polylepis.1